MCGDRRPKLSGFYHHRRTRTGATTDASLSPTLHHDSFGRRAECPGCEHCNALELECLSVICLNAECHCASCHANSGPSIQKFGCCWCQAKTTQVYTRYS